MEGAALLIDHVAVFTDSDGRFFLASGRPHAHKLQVLPDKFLNGGTYEVEYRSTQHELDKRCGGAGNVIIVKRVAGINAGRCEL